MGDTLLVTIDLGFHIFIRQRLRFTGFGRPRVRHKEGSFREKIFGVSTRSLSLSFD